MFRSPVLRTGDNLSITTLFSSSADHINSGNTDWKSSLDPMANHKKKWVMLATTNLLDELLRYAVIYAHRLDIYSAQGPDPAVSATYLWETWSPPITFFYPSPCVSPFKDAYSATRYIYWPFVTRPSSQRDLDQSVHQQSPCAIQKPPYRIPVWRNTFRQKGTCHCLRRELSSLCIWQIHGTQDRSHHIPSREALWCGIAHPRSTPQRYYLASDHHGWKRTERSMKGRTSEGI